MATTDQPAAKNFYTSLFGWAVNDFPMGPGQFYSMFSLEGRNTGAAYTLDAKNMPGVPPNWTLYIATENADESAAKATAAGGAVLGGPFDVMEFGRMAVLQDPAGATFCVWQPKMHHGLGIQHVEGTLSWADLCTSSPDDAAPFYKAVFGWKLEKGDKDDSGYIHILNGEHFIGGIPPAHGESKTPPHWLIYFQVNDADAAAARAQQLGARVIVPTTTMEGVGRWSIVADPQGAVFALFQPAEHRK